MVESKRGLRQDILAGWGSREPKPKLHGFIDGMDGGAWRGISETNFKIKWTS